MAKARAFKLTAPTVREPAMHRQVADVLRLELAAPGRISKAGVVWWSVDMVNYGGIAPGLRTRRGCIAGVPDIIVLYEGRAHFIELKAHDGLLSPAQQTLGTAVLLGCSSFAIARTVEEVLRVLDVWGIPRGHRVAAGAAPALQNP